MFERGFSILCVLEFFFGYSLKNQIQKIFYHSLNRSHQPLPGKGPKFSSTDKSDFSFDLKLNPLHFFKSRRKLERFYTFFGCEISGFEDWFNMISSYHINITCVMSNVMSQLFRQVPQC